MGNNNEFIFKEMSDEENISNQNKLLKLFISYSHEDNDSKKDVQHINEFIKHIQPLIKNQFIKIWYDGHILPNEEFMDEIEFNLEDADIICLFISANYLASKSCIDEKESALKLKRMKNVPVIPIILSPCGWLDETDISKMLALPKDGKPVLKFDNRDDAWYNVYSELKKVIDKEILMKKITINEQFTSFLQNTEMLKKAHSKKENIYLNDIYIHTELDKYDSFLESNEIINSDDLLDITLNKGKIIIAGENQSGKTTLCKKLFCELRKINFFPVYISNHSEDSSGKIENIIQKSLKEQYNDISIENIPKERIIPIIDDFHLSKKIEKYIKNLSNYQSCIITIDDVFSLNIKDKTILSSFTNLRIKELKPSLRYELVKKWSCLSEKDIIQNYKDIDVKINLINATLGRNIGKGIMPAYPFYILSTIVTYETFSISYDQNISSQGYCYQAFIYYYLIKQGVKNDEIDTYINFLTELASHMYKSTQMNLDQDIFFKFMDSYSKKYILPVKEVVLLNNLSDIISKNNFGFYSFNYLYLYYFFVAKYLAENMEDNNEKEIIKRILNNLHVDENAYIAIFLTHHSKSNEIFDNIEEIASSLFINYEPATLTKNETKFFDEKANIIVDAVLPSLDVTPEMERTERLNIQDKIEQSQEENINENNSLNNEIDEDIRKAVKTVEVMGCIIRNRAGSLAKERLQKLFISGMNVHLRILSYFFESIKSEEIQNELIHLISEKIKQYEEDMDSNQKLNEEKREKLANRIFWNFSFLVVYGLINKIIHSLGSDKITEITNNVCNEIDNPTNFLIKHGIFMEYKKMLDIHEVAKMFPDNYFSKIPKHYSKISNKVMMYMIADFCSINNLDYRERQQIKMKFNIPCKNPKLKS